MIDITKLYDYDNGTLLEALNDERGKFTRSDKSLMGVLIEELIQREVYPKETVPGNPNSVAAMVQGYGAWWHIWDCRHICPKCNADLRDHRVGPPYLRVIAVYSRDSDRTEAWKCPDCGHQWPR